MSGGADQVITMACCPKCKQESPLYFRSKDYNQNITKDTFNHYRCTRCELIFIAPIPDNLSNYYSTTYYSVAGSKAHLEISSKSDQYKIEIVQRYMGNGDLLEIGAAYGKFAYLAKKAGFEVDAIEMNAQCCKFMNEVVGVNAIESNEPISVLQKMKHHDVISLWHVIEHLPDPWLTLDAVCKNLKPGGIAIVATPNPDAFQFQIMGRYWPHIDAPRHLMLIPMKLLAEKLDSLGMKVELITTTDRGSISLNAFGWWAFFANLSSQVYIKRTLRLIGRLVSILFIPIDRMEGKGSTYVMVFRKM